jgi:hypothetical protein
MRVLIAFLALVALSWAVPIACNATYVCQKENQQCGFSYGPDVFARFASGLGCNNNNCQRRPTLGESCSGSLTCYDPDYSGITCDTGNVCRFADIYGAGDSCKPTDPNYKNGGCVSGLTCDTTTSKCQGLGAGADCSSGNSLRNCNPNLFCNSNNQCATKLAAGQACNANHECDPELICSDEPGNAAQRTCVTPFTVASGASCNSNFDCGKTLGCDSNDKCSAAGTDGQACETDTDICSEFADCVCQLGGVNSTAVRELGVAKCENQAGLQLDYNTGSSTDDFLSMQRCLKSKGCHDYWDYISIGLESGPDQCISKCLKKNFETGYEKAGNGFNECGSSVIIPGLIVILSLIAAFFF